MSYTLNAKAGYRDGDADTTYAIASPLEASDGHHGYSSPRGDGADNLVTAYALRKDPGGTGQGHNTNYATNGSAVRRLTPVECERLQALPDNWTRVPDDAPDSRRYEALGDAVTASVAEWIGRRILQEAAA